MAKGFKRSIILEFDPSQVKKGAAHVNEAMRSLDAEYRKVVAGMDKNTAAAQKLGAQKDMLTKKIEVQKKRIDTLTQEYNHAKNTNDEYSATVLRKKKTLDDAQTALLGLQKQLQETSREFDKKKGALGRAGDAARELGVTYDGVSNGLLGVGAALTGVSVLAAHATMNFDDAMAKIHTRLDTTVKTMDEARRATLNVANAFNISAQEVANAGFKLLDAGLATQDYYRGLQNAAMLARNEHMSMADASNHLMIITRQFNKDIDQQTEAVDRLVLASRNSNMSVDYMTQMIGRAGLTVKASGMDFDDFTASVMAMGNTSMDARFATRALEDVITAIAKPTSQATEAAWKMGIQWDAASNSSRSFEENLELLTRMMHNSGTNNGDFIKSLHGVEAAFAIAGPGMQTFRDNLKMVQNSTGAAEAQLAILTDTAGEDMRRAMNDMQLALTRAGDAFQPIISAVAQFVSWLAQAHPGVIAVAGGIGVLAIAVGTLVKAYKALKPIYTFFLAKKKGMAAASVAEATANKVVAASNTAVGATAKGAAPGVKALGVAKGLMGAKMKTMLPVLMMVTALLAVLGLVQARGQNNQMQQKMAEMERDMRRKEEQMQRMQQNVNAGINNVPRFARGTNYHRGGLALVGEEGPELVDLPRGSRVHTAQQTRSMLGGSGQAKGMGGDTHHYNLNVHFDDIDQVQKLVGLFENLSHKRIVFSGTN